MTPLFTKTFWLKAIGLAITTGVGGFVAAVGQSTAISLNDLKMAGIAFGFGFFGSIAQSIISRNAVSTAIKTGRVAPRTTNQT